MVKLTVSPNQSVGIGTSTQIDLRFDSDTHNLLVNPINIPTSGVSSPVQVGGGTNYVAVSGRRWAHRTA